MHIWSYLYCTFRCICIGNPIQVAPNVRIYEQLQMCAYYYEMFMILYRVSRMPYQIYLYWKSNTNSSGYAYIIELDSVQSKPDAVSDHYLKNKINLYMYWKSNTNSLICAHYNKMLKIMYSVSRMP